MKKPRHNRGFTLVETLVVVCVIGVLATLIVPRLSWSKRKAQLAEAMQMSSAIARAEMRYYYQHQVLTTDLSLLDLNIPLNAKNHAALISTAFPGASYYAWNVGGHQIGIGLGFDPDTNAVNHWWDHKLGLDMTYDDNRPTIAFYWWRGDAPGKIGGADPLNTSTTGWHDIQ